jgi:hypothetical protein
MKSESHLINLMFFMVFLLLMEGSTLSIRDSMWTKVAYDRWLRARCTVENASISEYDCNLDCSNCKVTQSKLSCIEALKYHTTNESSLPVLQSCNGGYRCCESSPEGTCERAVNDVECEVICSPGIIVTLNITFHGYHKGKIVTKFDDLLSASQFKKSYDSGRWFICLYSLGEPNEVEIDSKYLYGKWTITAIIILSAFTVTKKVKWMWLVEDPYHKIAVPVTLVAMVAQFITLFR